MASRVEKASETFANGYNCAQAVFSAFSPDYGMEEKDALKTAAAFGSGMARLQEVCGAVTGAFMAFGIANGEVDPSNAITKAATYDQVREFSSRFRVLHGSILCRDILGIDLNTEEGQQTLNEKDLLNTVCAGCVRHAAEITEDLLTEE